MFKRLKTKIAAFTLAEVLVTLGVIGIVAALTIPSLMTNYKKKVTAIRLKEAYAIIKQAYRLAEAEYGPGEGWQEFNVAWDYETGKGSAGDDATESAVKKYLAPYVGATNWDRNRPQKLGLPKQLNSKFTANLFDPIRLRLKNGMILDISTIYNDWDTFVWMPIFIDLDGDSGPYELGKDVFVMAYYIPKPKKKGNQYIRKNDSGAYLIGEGNSEEDLKKMGNYGCQNGTTNGPMIGANCGAWVMQNNWEFPKDYPWK
ncbi:MAG: type II secretion system GspH family protein [Muribaculaceae bacterium]|nr:type II secretion system GspH family protein [Muribaculaceae bacterium]